MEKRFMKELDAWIRRLNSVFVFQTIEIYQKYFVLGVRPTEIVSRELDIDIQ